MKKSQKHLVEFAEDGEVYLTDKDSILEASLSAGIPHFHDCGGKGKCSTCRVFVIKGAEWLTPPNSNETVLKNQMHFPPNVRLACQTYVTGGPVKLRRIIHDETDIGLYVGSKAGDSTQQLGEEKELTLMFLDIRNFTEFVENHPPFDVIHIIRKLFSVFQAIIEVNDGKIVETSGDGFYAVFGFDSNKIECAQSAVLAAYAILSQIEALNESYFQPHFEGNIRVGVGVHVGRVVMGIVKVGKEDHSVVMGHPVNIASRLQSATKELNNDFIISEDVFNLLVNPSGTPQPKTILVRGISKPLTIYLMGKPYKGT